MKGASEDEASLVLLVPVAAIIQSLLLVRNIFTLPSPGSIVMPLIQGCLVVGLLWTWAWLRKQASPGLALQKVLPPVLIGVGLLLPVEQALTGNGMLAANLALMLVVGGALIADKSRFFVFCALLASGWIIALTTHPAWNVSVADQATYVALGCLIGMALFLLRRADRRRLEASRDSAYASAMRDPLTGLWNRRGMAAILPSMVGAAHENQTGIWCLFMDVRGLKRLNDSAGHAAGDRLLAAVGDALQTTEVIGGVPARWGGDEFCVLGVGDPVDVRVAHEHLVALVSHKVGPQDHWDLSLGSAYADALHGEFLEGLVHHADEDMYRRRREGRMSPFGS